MKIWVDADACPGPVRDIVFRAAERLQVEAVFVANKFLNLPKNQFLKFVQVPFGDDVADHFIVQNAVLGDLVITQDIPLASNLIDKEVAVMGLRGDIHTKESIGERLALRNFADGLRGAGVHTGGPNAYGQKEKQRFASAFDRVLHVLHKKSLG